MARPANTSGKLSYYMKKKLERQAAAAVKPAKQMSDAEIRKQLHERFSALDELTEMCISGNARSLICSGPGGVGKSYSVEKRVAAWDPNKTKHTIVKGFIRATGLYKLAYRHRQAGEVLIFDDADSVFFDGDSLNLLKSMCDTTEGRFLMWGAETSMEDDDGEKLPTSFEFKGTVIFITNLDFDKLIASGSKIATHLEAMVSRSHYVDMAMNTKRHYLIRIEQVIRQGMLDYLNESEKNDVIEFIDKFQDSLRELSLRMAIKLGNLRKGNTNWERIAKITCCKNI